MLYLLLSPFLPKNKSHCFLFQCTTYDLLEKGIEVHIVADAVSSRRCLNFPVAYYSDCGSSLRASNKYLEIENRKDLIIQIANAQLSRFHLTTLLIFPFTLHLKKKSETAVHCWQLLHQLNGDLCVFLRSQTDRLFALSRLKQSGAYLTTTEAVLLQLVRDAKHPNFKEVLRRHSQPLFIRRLSLSVYPDTNLAVHPQVLSKVVE